MAKRKPAPADGGLKLLELQLAVIQHCNALRAVADFLDAGNLDAATARLDGAVAALKAVVRGQSVGVTMACPACGSQQGVVAWVDDGRCDHCGGELKAP
jgi:hypothetical protein